MILRRSDKKVHGGEYWYSVPGAIRQTQQTIIDYLRGGKEVTFTKADECDELFKLIMKIERGGHNAELLDWNKKGDVNLVNRIIRNGGIDYLRQLDKKVGK